MSRPFLRLKKPCFAIMQDTVFETVKSRKTAPFYLVEATGLEPAASWSQTNIAKMG